MIRLQHLVIISVLLRLRFIHSFPHQLSQNGIKIVTYGEPCPPPPQYLSVKIEEPIQEPGVSREFPGTLSCLSSYQPLKLNYETVSYNEPPIISEPRREYPISVDVPPQLPPGATECETLVAPPDLLRGKSYRYNIETMPQKIESPPVKATYNFDLQVPPPSSPLSPSGTSTLSEKPIKLLTGLTSRIDRVLVPACEVPLTGCSCRE